MVRQGEMVDQQIDDQRLQIDESETSNQAHRKENIYHNRFSYTSYSLQQK